MKSINIVSSRSFLNSAFKKLPLFDHPNQIQQIFDFYKKIRKKPILTHLPKLLITTCAPTKILIYLRLNKEVIPYQKWLVNEHSTWEKKTKMKKCYLYKKLICHTDSRFNIYFQLQTKTWKQHTSTLNNVPKTTKI